MQQWRRKAHDDCIRGPAIIAAQRTDENPCHKADGQYRQGNGQRGPRSLQGAGEHIPAHMVAAEQVAQGRPGVPVRSAHGSGGVGCPEGPQHTVPHRQHGERQPQGKIPVFLFSHGPHLCLSRGSITRYSRSAAKLHTTTTTAMNATMACTTG